MADVYEELADNLLEEIPDKSLVDRIVKIIFQLYSGTLIYYPIKSSSTIIEKNKQIVKAWNDGQTINSIAKQFGTSSINVYRIIQRRNMK